MTQTSNTTRGTIRMSNNTVRVARQLPNGDIEYLTFSNANSTRGKAWKKASAKQSATFVQSV